jgi:hypothetical protein
MAVVVVTGSWFVFLPPVPYITSHLPEVCLFDSGSSVSGHSPQQMPLDGDPLRQTTGGRRCRVATWQALKEDD